MHFVQRLCVLLAAMVLLSSAAQAADHVKFGIFKAVGTSAVFIAQDKGYFAAEGLDVELVPFTAQEPLVLGIASGDLDFGATALPAASTISRGRECCASSALSSMSGRAFRPTR